MEVMGATEAMLLSEGTPTETHCFTCGTHPPLLQDQENTEVETKKKARRVKTKQLQCPWEQ